MITPDLIRGNTDMIIMAQLVKHDSYGYEINKEIQRATNGKYELKEATLYTAFKRLTDSGYITSYWGDENKGARRRYYKITEDGKTAFETLTKEWEEAKVIIDSLI